jgi:curved DNA-binding protein
MEYKDYYKILGVSKTATKDEIKKRYRVLARKYHPDKNPDDKSAEDRFKEVQEAYEVLGNDEHREKYDRLGANWKQYANAGSSGGFDFSEWAKRGGGRSYRSSYDDMFGGGGNFSDFFQSFFGGGFGGGDPFGGQGFGGGSGFRQAKGRDYRSEININLTDAYNGTSTLLNVGGEKIRINIKPGVKNGQTLRVKGKGAPASGGGQNGDLLLKVNVANNTSFKIHENDLILDLHVDLYVAMLGGKITFNTFGNPISITLPPETPNGKTLRLKGKGMPVFGHPGRYGDLYLNVVVALPENLSDEEKSLFGKLSALRK